MATAYGKTPSSRLSPVRNRMSVIGVIEAAAFGALEARGSAGNDRRPGYRGHRGVRRLPQDDRGACSPRRTPPAALRVHKAYGLAGASTGRELIVANVADDRPRLDYRGPTLTNPLAPIDRQLLPRYQFDFRTACCEGTATVPQPANQLRGELHRLSPGQSPGDIRAPDPRPLTVVILGCTHFPFYTDSFRAQLARLHDYRENGAYVYRPCLAADVRFIDPAVHVGRELYQRLAGKKQLAESTGAPPKPPRGEFYITVPRRDHPGVQLDPSGWFTYDYKYGRGPDDAFADVRAVPWDQRYLEPEVTKALPGRAPTVWGSASSISTGRREKNPPGHP